MQPLVQQSAQMSHPLVQQQSAQMSHMACDGMQPIMQQPAQLPLTQVSPQASSGGGWGISTLTDTSGSLNGWNSPVTNTNPSGGASKSMVMSSNSEITMPNGDVFVKKVSPL